MRPPIWIAAIVACLSLLTAGGGWLLVRRAHAVPAPATYDVATVPGTVIDVLATPCRARRSRGTCFLTVVGYELSGRAMQVVSRSAYRPAANAKGERVSVILPSDGSSWIGAEWNAHQAELRRDFDSARGFPLMMGWLLVGCGGFGLLLAFGLVFFVDRSAENN